MKFFKRHRSQSSTSVLLEAENHRVIENPSEEEVRKLILDLRLGDTSFASLTNEKGDYLQVAGSRPWCVIEFRRRGPNHERAFQETLSPKYNDGAKLRTGAGDIVMRHDEWFLLKDAADLFCSFLRHEPFPPHVNWRSMNETLGLF